MPFFVHVSVPLVAAVSGAVLHELLLIIVTEIETAAVSLGDASCFARTITGMPSAQHSLTAWAKSLSQLPSTHGSGRLEKRKSFRSFAIRRSAQSLCRLHRIVCA
jgi:hypothetical protein